MTLIKSISGIRGTVGGAQAENLTPPRRREIHHRIRTSDRRAESRQKTYHSRRPRRPYFGRNGLRSGRGHPAGLRRDVINVGLCTTPGTEMAVITKRADGGNHHHRVAQPASVERPEAAQLRREFLTDAEGKRALRAKVTQDIYAQRCQQARAVAEQALIAQLGTHVTGPLPKQLVGGNYFAEQRQFNLRMQANGVNFDQYLKVQGQTVEEFRAWLHAEAEHKLRSRMGLLLVAQKEGLWPTEAEVDDELAHWDAKRDGEHTFASNDRRRAAPAHRIQPRRCLYSGPLHPHTAAC